MQHSAWSSHRVAQYYIICRHLAKRQKILGLFLILVIGALPIFCVAQNVDSMVLRARQFAFDDHNFAAAAATLQPISDTTRDTELLAFLGRIYAWNKQPDSARSVLHKAIRLNASYMESYLALADMETWEGNYDTALQVVLRGLIPDSSNKDLLLRKARILYYKKDYKQALAVADTLLQIDKGNTEARVLVARIRDNVSKNRIGVKYDYIYFDKQFPQPWQYLSLDYSYQSKVGSVTARLNYANRFGKDALQYEVEAYPIFSRRFYGYVNVAHSSDAGVFPRWKLGGSLFANLPSAYEAELGVRHLSFDNSTFIFTAYIGKYIRNFLFGARTYLSPGNGTVSATYNFSARYYYGGVDDFVGANAGVGISPDDRQINVQLNSLYRLKTYRGELLVRHAFRKLNVFLLNVSLAQQEYLPMTSGLMLQGGIGYIRRF